MDLARVDVVLVRPARAANVAAAARALKNMGLVSLSLVDPPPGLDRAEARNLAYGAWDVLDRARAAPDLRTAVAGCTLVAATSGRAEGAESPRDFAERAASLAAGGRLAVVFGPESSGLTNDELALCRVRVRIPTDDAHPSVNLAQAVLVLAYELRLAALGAPAVDEPPPRATAGELESALDDLREALLAVEYLNPAAPERVMAELRGLLLRAEATPREITLLRGIARQVRWAGGRIAKGGAREP
jgi:tRNA (cytidine32/uridine32-2'-O)-methyltransferase